MRHAIRGFLLGLGLLVLAPAAFAHTDVQIGIGLDGYAAPPPVYYAPPPPVYYAPPPVVYGYPDEYWHHHHRDWDDERWHGEHEHRWRHHHGHEGDDD